MVVVLDWCKAQDQRSEIIAAVEREEQLSGGQLLTHDVLTKLAKETIK